VHILLTVEEEGKEKKTYASPTSSFQGKRREEQGLGRRSDLISEGKKKRKEKGDTCP